MKESGEKGKLMLTLLLIFVALGYAGFGSGGAFVAFLVWSVFHGVSQR